MQEDLLDMEVKRGIMSDPKKDLNAFAPFNGKYGPIIFGIIFIVVGIAGLISNLWKRRKNDTKQQTTFGS